MAAKRSSGRALPFVFGFLFAVMVVAVGGWAYFRFGTLPVAVKDKPFPSEEKIAHTALKARIARETVQPPFSASEDAYERGASVYREECAICHGAPGQDSPYGEAMYPAAPQLWKKHAKSNVVGVSDDPAGATYWVVKNGVRLTGMPQFGDSLSDAEMWDVALLLKDADQRLPDPVMKELKASR